MLCAALALLWTSTCTFAQTGMRPPTGRAKLPGAIALTGVTVVDSARGVHSDGMTVLVRGERIAAVFPDGERALPDDTEVRELGGRYVIPGLINAHVHLFRRFVESPAAMHAELERMLRGGVVAVRDMAGDARVIAAARRGILAGELAGPDIHGVAMFSGPVFASRDPRMTRASLGYGAGEAPWAQAVTDDTDLVRAVARADGTQATALKLYVGLAPELITRITDEAHRQGLLVWSHATVYPSRPIEVVRGGADAISHACGIAWQDADLDPAPYAGANARRRPAFDPALVEIDSPEMALLFDEMVARDIVFDPTLSNHARPGDDRFGCTSDLMVGLTRAAHEAGVAIAAGTDWYSPLDDPTPTVVREMEALVSNDVLTPSEALIAATLNAARAMGKEADYGTIEAGKFASLVVLEADPSKDLEALGGVAAVMRRGAFVE